MSFLKSDEFLVTVVPIIVYWGYSGIYDTFINLDRYQLHSNNEEESQNLVPKREVVKGVLVVQAIQVTFSLTIFKVTAGDDALNNSSSDASFVVIITQFLFAMVVFDTWQYFIHRLMHVNQFLYRKFHSIHHRLSAPYAYGAQYNHPVDSFLIEILGGTVTYVISGMSIKTSIIFFAFATMKGINDHCGFLLPWNPLPRLFSNNSAYHELHHQLSGSRCNFAQPFFPIRDKLMGTYVPYKLVRREAGGYQVRMA